MKRALTLVGSPITIGDPRNIKKIHMLGEFFIRTSSLQILLSWLLCGQLKLNFIMAGWMGHCCQVIYCLVKISGLIKFPSHSLKMTSNGNSIAIGDELLAYGTTQTGCGTTQTGYGATPVGCRGESRYVEGCWGLPDSKIRKFLRFRFFFLCLGSKNLPNFHVVFSGIYWSHIQAFQDFIWRICGIFGARIFKSCVTMHFQNFEICEK